MFTEVHVNTSMEEEFSQTMSGIVKKLIEKKEIKGTSNESLKQQTYNLMKQLAKKIVYQQTNQSTNGETKTELTAKTEFSMRESVYTFINKKPKRKKKECSRSQVLKQNTRSLHYSNICEMIKSNTTKVIRNKLTLRENSKKIVKKRTYSKDKSLVGNIESMEKLLSTWKKDFKKKSIVEDLKWSMKSTYKSFVMQNEITEQEIKPVPIVPPLPLPMWGTALEEPPQAVILRRTPSLNAFFDPHTLRSKVFMKRRTRNGSRRSKACMIPAETLARALSSPKWNKGPRQVPVATFQATRIHYRFLLAKYGKSRLMGRHRVYPNSIKPSVHSHFSVINLLHDVEEAISQNKYSKETDKIVKKFKDELNKDLLYNEPTNKKFNKYQMNNTYNAGARKKSKCTKQSSGISLSELIGKLGGNETDDSYNETEFGLEEKLEACIENEQSHFNKNDPLINYLVDSESNNELFKSLNNDHPITDAHDKLKNYTDDTEQSKISHNKKFTFKEKRNIKRKKTLIKESKPESISEEERLTAILQELHKQVKASEIHTPLLLTKNDSLTELNFQKEPCTYLSMHASSINIDTDSQHSNLESTVQKECNSSELSQQESKQSLMSSTESIPTIKKNKPLKGQNSSTKLYTFKMDYECIKNKPLNICNIITALDRVNKLLQNIPIQYDKNTGRPYIVYDPKSIVKVIKEVNVKHEYKMVVKKYNKKSKSDIETEKSSSETTTVKNSKIETPKQDEKGLEEVGNQLFKCILNSMEPQNIDECIECNNKDELSEYSQALELENCHQCLADKAACGPGPSEQLPKTTESADQNIETIRYAKKYLEQRIKTGIKYHMTGIYHQVIIYTERQEYINDVRPTVQNKPRRRGHDSCIQEINQKKTEEKSKIKLSNSSYADLKEKYTDVYRERKIQNEKHLTNESFNQPQPNVSHKYYHQYNKTRKFLLSKYEHKTNNKDELGEQDLGKIYLKPNIPENRDTNETEKYARNNTFKKRDLSNIIRKYEVPNKITNVPSKRGIHKEQNIFDEKRYKTTKDAELVQSLGSNDLKNKNYLIQVQNSLCFNPFVTFEDIVQKNTSKNDLINSNNNYQGTGRFSLNKSIFNNMLRSASINTIHNAYPMKKDTTKQVFYFQTTYPLIEGQNRIYKKQPSLSTSSPHNILSKFIDYKGNNQLQTYKQNINQHVLNSVNTVKNELNKNISNICQIVNIDSQLLTKFLKICLKQNEIDFEEDQKSLILEKEMEALKSQMSKLLGKRTNPLRVIQKKHERNSLKRSQKMAVFVKDTKIKEALLKNETNHAETITYQVLNKNKLCTEILRFFNILMLIFSFVSYIK